jgi:class 3 adenylate cyclase
MEPRIQYAQTKDGVSIAFWTMGEGMPFLVVPSFPYSHCQRAWELPEVRRYDEAIGRNRRLVRFDYRGTGLSQRSIAEYSMDALLLDLEAVVERLKLEKFVLYAELHGGPLAISYAARHPDQVSRLILWCAWARATDFFGSPRVRAFGRALERDWESYTEAASYAMSGWSHGDFAHRIAAYLRDCISEEAAKAAYRAVRQFDVSELLRQVSTSTLVLHPQGFRLMDMDIPTGLASELPDARLTLIEGAASSPSICDVDAIAGAIDEFLGEGEEGEAAAEAPEAGAFRTVLFTDVEGSTALTQRLGDAKARALLRQHERIVREALKAHGGSELKTIGDGFMASFSSATRALESAIAMQRAFAAHNQSAPEPIRVRVGLNAGEPIAEEDDLYGTAVNLAARIAAKAKGGEILASDVVRGLVAGKDFPFADRGRRKLRGFEQPVRLFEVKWQEEAT